MSVYTKFWSISKNIIKHPIAIILISSLLIILVTGLFKEFISKPILNTLFSSESIVKTITALLSSGVMMTTYYLLLKYYEKKPLTEFAQKFALRESTNGYLLGFGAIALTVLLLYFMGYYKFISFKNVMGFLPTLAFIFGAAILEEIIFRGLFFRLIENWKGPIAALIISSIIFQIPHFMNSHTGVMPAILGVLFGLVVALMYAYTRRLWLPIAFHFGWNIAQSTFGTTLSGVSELTSLAEANLNGPRIFIGSEFGIEVSIFSILSLIAIGSYFIIKLYRQNYFKRDTIIKNPTSFK